MKYLFLLISLTIALGCSTTKQPLDQPTAPTFSTPEAAVENLILAAESSDRQRLRELLGHGNQGVLTAGDDETEVRAMANFSALARQKHTLEKESDRSIRLSVGEDERQFPIPLKEVSGGWQFDLRTGEKELSKKNIERNEAYAVTHCGEIVKAQFKYASLDRDGDGVTEYAAGLTSSKGKHDGLYWESKDKQAGSLIEKYMARAATTEGDNAVPLHGYLFKILTRQANKSYIDSEGNMRFGFALLAYPARYDVTGINSYLVGKDGKVFVKDLGENTQKIAVGLREYKPENDWALVKEFDVTLER